MELSVHPEDLAAAATALRQAHAALASAAEDLRTTGRRLLPGLGVHAAATAEASLMAADQGASMVEDDIATFAQGLTAAAAYYAALDAQALGRVTVLR